MNLVHFIGPAGAYTAHVSGVGSAFLPRLCGSETASPAESRLGMAPGVPGILSGKMILFP